MVKQFNNMHWSSTQDPLYVKSYQEFKNRSMLLKKDRERCEKGKMPSFKAQDIS
jgi:hypothetical protein